MGNNLDPIVFLIDLDGTMIGNIQPQIDEYYIIKEINKEIKRVGKDKQIKYNMKNLYIELQNNIIRPKLTRFLKNVKKYENIEIFIYTASIKSWANFLIPKIEKLVNYKFNRPILSREGYININNYPQIKSIDIVKPIIYKKLKSKYNLRNINELKYISLIDNTKNVLVEKNLLIKCPSYDYIYQIDYIRNIPKTIISKYYYIVEKYLDLKHSDHIYHFYRNYYEHINIRYNMYLNKNKMYINDDYWNRFAIILKRYMENIKSFSDLLKILKKLK